MAKERKDILFSCNEIRIERITNVDFALRGRGKPFTIECNTRSVYDKVEPDSSNWRTSYRTKQNYPKFINKAFESRLGFYYTKRVCLFDVFHSEKSEPKELKTKFINVNLSSSKYILSYPIEYGGTVISIDTRPWDIAPKSKGMQDRMIQVLLREANKFFDIINDNKLVMAGRMTVEELRKQTFIDLFGYEDGPKIQPNNVKILAHGFDLKESFRKGKEEKK